MIDMLIWSAVLYALIWLIHTIPWAIVYPDRRKERHDTQWDCLLTLFVWPYAWWELLRGRW